MINEQYLEFLAFVQEYTHWHFADATICPICGSTMTRVYWTDWWEEEQWDITVDGYLCMNCGNMEMV